MRPRSLAVILASFVLFSATGCSSYTQESERIDFHQVSCGTPGAFQSGSAPGGSRAESRCLMPHKTDARDYARRADPAYGGFWGLNSRYIGPYRGPLTGPGFYGMVWGRGH